MILLRSATLSLLLATACLSAPAVANEPNPALAFYKDKPVTILVGFSTGNGADSYARLLSRHLGRYLANTNVIVQNMPGSGSLTMANYLYAVAPKDGSVFGVMNRNTPMEPLMGNKNARFDAAKFTWIGSTNAEPSLCVAWETSPVKKWEDAKEREFVVAGASLNANTGLVPTLLNRVLGTKMKLILGFPGSNEMSMAIERGEVEGRCGWSRSSLMSSRPSWVTDKKINLLLQAGLKKSPAMPDVPLAMDYVKNESDRQLLKLGVAWDEMAWPFAAPPDIPAARRDMLRQAFTAALQDKQLLAEAEKERLEVNIVSAEAIEALLADVLATPAPIVQEMQNIISGTSK